MIMNLPDIKYLTLICKQPMVAHWGDILITGSEYQGEIFFRDTEIITDYINYWKYIDLILKGSKFYLHESIPDYKSYTKTVEMPFIRVECSDTQTNSFCLLSDAELFELGADKRWNTGRPCFSYTVHLVDDYFDYTPIRRDNILNKILDCGN